MKKILVLFFVVLSASVVADVNQYFRYVDGEVIKIGYQNGKGIFTLSECADINCFLSIVKKKNRGERMGDDFFSRVKLLTPVPNPQQMIAAAMNFGDHKKETHLDKLILFPKNIDITPWNSFVPHYGEKKGLLDYEVELGFLVSRDVTKDDLEDKNLDLSNLIAGVFLILDMTSREIQVQKGSMFNSSKGFSEAKSLPGYAPCGQFFITYEDFKKSLGKFEMSLDINGQNRQFSKLEDMIYLPEEIIKISFMKKFRKRKFTSASGENVRIHDGKIFKGDIILSGTPTGMAFVAPTFKTKMKGFKKGIRKGKNPIKYAKKYIISNQPRHLHVGDKIDASGFNLGQIKVEITKP